MDLEQHLYFPIVRYFNALFVIALLPIMSVETPVVLTPVEMSRILYILSMARKSPYNR